MNKNPEIAAIGFASVGHTLCHLLTLLFPTVLLVLEVEMDLSLQWTLVHILLYLFVTEQEKL